LFGVFFSYAVWLFFVVLLVFRYLERWEFSSENIFSFWLNNRAHGVFRCKNNRRKLRTLIITTVGCCCCAHESAFFVVVFGYPYGKIQCGFRDWFLAITSNCSDVKSRARSPKFTPYCSFIHLEKEIQRKKNFKADWSE